MIRAVEIRAIDSLELDGKRLKALEYSLLRRNDSEIRRQGLG